MKKNSVGCFFAFAILICVFVFGSMLYLNSSVNGDIKREKVEINRKYIETPFPADFTTKLIQALPSHENNVASQLGAFAMGTLIANGVSGDAQQEMLYALSVPGVDNANDIVKTQMDNKSGKAEIYNSAWGDFLETYRKKVADLDTDLMSISQISELNAWISNRTHGLISNIGIRPNPLLRVVLVNIVYFKDKWRSPFDEKMTQRDIFYSLDGQEDTVQMMKSASMNVPYYENSELKSVKLPYKNGDEMIIIMPKGDFNEFIRDFQSEYLSLPYSNVKLTVHIPRFTIEKEVDLKTLFKNMGVNRIFEGGFDFNQMLVDSNMPESGLEMQQQAKIIVEESGTVAAAVTRSVIAFDDPLSNVSPELWIDHPFIFLIDKSLFIGTYVKGK